jgi:hypothetical protein
MGSGGMRETSGQITVTNYTQFVASPLAGETITELLARFSGGMKELFFEISVGDGDIFYTDDGAVLIDEAKVHLWSYVWGSGRIVIIDPMTQAQAAAAGTYTTRFLARGFG